MGGARLRPFSKFLNASALHRKFLTRKSFGQHKMESLIDFAVLIVSNVLVDVFKRQGDELPTQNVWNASSVCSTLMRSMSLCVHRRY
jgi:hypothetical protein